MPRLASAQRILALSEVDFQLDIQNSLQALASHAAAIVSTQFIPQSSYDAEKWAGTWGTLVNEYSQRSLSFKQDKLLAFSAIAQEMSKSRKDRYLVGLWKDDLPQNLLWKPCLHPRRQSVYRALSWSWASIDGTIDLPSPGWYETPSRQSD